MPELYFNKFPVISYANSTCRDITRRVTINASLRSSPALFDNYTLKAESRADLISQNYYDDPYYEWLIYHINGIIDPYYDWHMGNSDFNEFIIKKYGSVESAMNKVKHYQNNWASDDTEISVSTYDNTTLQSLRKYYTPVYGVNNKVLSYKRKSDDSVKNTNKMIDLTITINSGNGYVVGELVQVKQSTVVVGGGEVAFANSSVVKIKHISGNTSATNTLHGTDSNTASSITASTVTFENITDDEAIFWSPVYYYDYEQELNEKNKHIRLLNSRYALQTAEELRKAMKQ